MEAKVATTFYHHQLDMSFGFVGMERSRSVGRQKPVVQS
jgi:hypothetical protein